MTHHTAYALPQPTRLSPAVRPGPVALAPDRPRGAACPPAARPHTPRDIARELVTLLRERGHTHLYVTAFTSQAVLSLPRLTIWITTQSLTWTHHGQLTTWPTHDTIGAADHLTQLTHPRERL